jgi:hypothetical protein
MDTYDGQAYTIGSLTKGAVVYLIKTIREGGKALWKQVNMDVVMHCVNRGKRVTEDLTLDDDTELNVVDGYAWHEHAHERHSYVMSRGEQLSCILDWMGTPSVDRLPKVGKVKKKLTILYKTKLPAHTFLKKAIKMITLVDQDLDLVGMVETLDSICEGIQRGLDKLKKQERRAGVHAPVWRDTLRAQLAPEGAEYDIRHLFVPEDADGIPTAVTLQAELKRVANEVRKLREQEGQARVALSDTLEREIRSLCRDTRAEPSVNRLPMWVLCGGGAVEERLKEWSQGMHADLTFDSTMMLGILHLFCIRGWATLLCSKYTHAHTHARK